MNKVFVIGRLTREPEIRSTAAGKKVAGFSIAVNEGKDSQGQEMVQYFDLSAWDRLAEVVEMYVKKGSKVAVIGALRNRSWEKADGTKGRATEIVVKELEIISSKMDGESQPGGNNGGSPSSYGGGSSSAPSKPSTPKPQSDDDEPEPYSDPKDLPEINVDDINVQMPF